MTDTAGPQFVLGGYRNDTSPNYKGVRGPYWSSSASTDATRAYNLLLNGTTSAVNPTNYNDKRFGFSLRCLVQNQTKNKKPSRLNKKTEQRRFLNPSASQPVALLENTKLSTITIIAILL